MHSVYMCVCVFMFVPGVVGGSVIKELGSWPCGCEFKLHQVWVYFHQKKKLVHHTPNIPTCKWGPGLGQEWTRPLAMSQPTVVNVGLWGAHTKVVTQAVLLQAPCLAPGVCSAQAFNSLEWCQSALVLATPSICPLPLCVHFRIHECLCFSANILLSYVHVPIYNNLINFLHPPDHLL